MHGTTLKPRSAAARQRLHRERQSLGIAIVPVAIDHWQTTVALIERGHLTEAEALDTARVGEALSRVIAMWTTSNA